MSKLLIYRIVVSILLIGVIFSLLSEADWLSWRVKILFGFHLGTIIAWIGLTAASLLAININRENPKLRFTSSLSFYIAIFWLLISFLLAGNNNLIFSQKREFAFYCWISISLIPLGVLIFSLIYNLIKNTFYVIKRK